MSQYSAAVQKQLLHSQKDEETGHLLYLAMAKREKNPENKKILLRMGQEEKEHAKVWQRYTGVTVKANRLRVWWLNLMSILLGYTFVIKLVQKDEHLAVDRYQLMEAEVPDAAWIMAQEHEHEETLITMLDEERLQYVGSMVLGLNDALVELTGAISGLTFALMDTRVVALSGIITGVSATLSMAASNYLAERADGNPNALKSSLFTGIAYVITVTLLVLPYLLLPRDQYVLALVVMLATVVLIILVFNYYIATAKSQPFWPRFTEMAVISLSVALIAFVIGLLAKALLGVDIA